MKLSIIIVNWNTRELTLQCLCSVACALDSIAPGSVETIVVDNGSQDGSVAALSEIFPWTKLIVNQTNLGFARANNQGIETSTGDFVLLLNSDTVVEPTALVTLLHFMQTHPQAGAGGARLLNPDGSIQPSCSPFPTLGREAWRLFHLDAFHLLALYPMHAWPISEPRVVDVVQGACMVIRRTALDQVGPLDCDYFMYSEEVDLCLRIRRAGWDIYWIPQAEVTHYGGQSSKLMAQAMFLQLYRSKVVYFRKHHGRWSAVAYKLLLATAALARLAVAPFAWRLPITDRHSHQELVAAYRRLLSTLWRY